MGSMGGLLASKGHVSQDVCHGLTSVTMAS